MRKRHPFHLPFVDLAIILAMLFIAWAVYRLAKMEPQISNDRQQSQAFQEVFKECQTLFGETINRPELARRESNVQWYEAVTVKREYHAIADRLEADLPELSRAPGEYSLRKRVTERQRTIHGLKVWLEKQKERIGLERLDSGSKELKAQVDEAQLSGTNGPIEIEKDLGTLLKEIDRTYQSYLSDLKAITNNTGKPFVGDFVARHLEQATKAVGLLSDLASEARRDGKAIKLFLENQSRSETTRRLHRQEEVVQAFLEAGSPAEFAARIGSEAQDGNSSGAVVTGATSPFQYVRYALLAALAGLAIFLIVHLYWRTAVIPLRLKLVERETDIEHQKKLAHFEQVAAGLAHEIRNPLTTISARLYTVRRKLQDGTPEHKDAIIIGNEIERVNQILKEFIHLARPSPPKLAPMTAEALLKDVSDLMAPQLHQQAIRLECQSQTRAQFRGDEQQLKQVLINLIQNAAESMERDGAIILRAHNGSNPLKGTQTKVVVIEVEDNGPGIRPEVQGKLFEPFFSTKKGGTGLGLPISARIIDHHAGTLEFETQEGQGTIFRIVLPAYEEA